LSCKTRDNQENGEVKIANSSIEDSKNLAKTYFNTQVLKYWRERFPNAAASAEAKIALALRDNELTQLKNAFDSLDKADSYFVFSQANREEMRGLAKKYYSKTATESNDQLAERDVVAALSIIFLVVMAEKIELSPSKVIAYKSSDVPIYFERARKIWEMQ
jgi:hypothetical protein